MEFTSPSGPSHNNIHTPGLNMELVHDFGEGVGVDMRDFNTGEKDDIGALLPPSLLPPAFLLPSSLLPSSLLPSFLLPSSFLPSF
jgi:hypothetical protein